MRLVTVLAFGAGLCGLTDADHPDLTRSLAALWRQWARRTNILPHLER